MRRRSDATFGIKRHKTWHNRSLHSEKSPGYKFGEILFLQGVKKCYKGATKERKEVKK
jgi:hypothetical protein